MVFFFVFTNVICFVSVYHTNIKRLPTTPTQSLIRSAIFSRAGPPKRVNFLTHYESTSVKCFSQEHNNTLHSLETEPRMDYPAVANLRSYTLSYTATSWDTGVECFFLKTRHLRIAQRQSVEF